jgi:hypothetical protein
MDRPLCRPIGTTPLAILTKGGALAEDLGADQAKWYGFSGEIRRAETKAVLVGNIENAQSAIEAIN